MRSIIGTTMTDRSSELEAHDAPYFVDRASVVAIDQGSAASFGPPNAPVARARGPLDEYNGLVGKYNGKVARIDEIAVTAGDLLTALRPAE